VPDWLESLCPAAFAFREPVAALNLLSEDMSTSRIATVDRVGVGQTLYEGPAMHYSLCCLDAGTVIARREYETGRRSHSEVVEYTAAGEAVLAGGPTLLDAQVLATAHGFVVGFKLTSAAVVVADGAEAELDVARYGLRRADVLAVDAAGTRIAFADGNRILVTDDRLRPLLAHTVGSARDGFRIATIAFTADALVVAGERGELRRFLADGSDGLVADPTSDRTDPRVNLHPRSRSGTAVPGRCELRGRPVRGRTPGTARRARGAAVPGRAGRSRDAAPRRCSTTSATR
jgi:hypothetical protein